MRPSESEHVDTTDALRVLLDRVEQQPTEPASADKAP
jgi:hypothetical protein